MNDEIDQSLDQLLRQARWPEPAPGAVERLTRAYRQPRWNWSRVALAASVLIAVGLSASMFNRRTPLAPHRVVPAVHAMAVGRAPSKLELATLRSIEKREQREKLAPQSPAAVPQVKVSQVAPPLAPPSGEQLERMALDAHSKLETRRESLVQLLGRNDERGPRVCCELAIDASTRSLVLGAIDVVQKPPVDRFIDRLSDPRVEMRLAAARILGHIDGPELTKRLATMAQQNENRREAMMALVASRGSEAKQFVREASKSGALAGVTRSILAQPELELQ